METSDEDKAGKHEGGKL